MRRLTPAALGLALALGSAGCKPKHDVRPPARVDAAKPHSDEGPLVDLVITAFSQGDVAELRRKMSLDLRSRISLPMLTAASQQLREHFGRPLGILEEHTHTEGELRWYSGLVLHGDRLDQGRLTPVLYQFAYSKQGSLARFLVREHWFIEKVDVPAEDYVPVTRFHFPSRGEWSVMHGGRTRAQNYHHGHRIQRFAFDLVVRVGGRQRKPRSSKKRNDSYFCYGKDILAPAAGQIVVAINDVAENVPGKRGHAGGNGVIIDHGFGEFSAIWHAIPGSLTVGVGDHVDVGQVLGKVGNSGRSTGPHIHYHANYRVQGARKPDKFGIPVEFVDVLVDGNWKPRKMPVKGQTVQRADETRKKARANAGPRVLVDL